MVNEFIADYTTAVRYYVDYIWDNRIETNGKICNIRNQQYKLGAYLPDKVKPESELSARAMKCAATQAIGIVKSKIKKLSKLQYVIKKKQRKGEYASKLQRKYDKEYKKLKKPEFSVIYPELNSICCKYVEKKTNFFDGYIVLSSIGKKYGKIHIPIKLHKHYDSLISIGKLKSSFLITEKNIMFRVEIDVPKLKEIGDIEGCDQGIIDALTLSDGQRTPRSLHGHTLHTILKTLAKKKKGSKAFRRTQELRTNYINWCIKQIKLNTQLTIKE